MCIFAASVASYFKRISILLYLSFLLSVLLPVLLSFGLWKYDIPVIRFALNNLFLSHNNESVRGGVMKAFLVVSYSMVGMCV